MGSPHGSRRTRSHRRSSFDCGRVDSMEQAISEGRSEQVVVANTHFHDVIYAAAGNEVLERLGRDLREFVRRFTTLPFASAERVDHVLNEHRDIVTALENHDPDAAEAASRAHLSAARKYVAGCSSRSSRGPSPEPPGLDPQASQASGTSPPLLSG